MSIAVFQVLLTLSMMLVMFSPDLVVGIRSLRKAPSNAANDDPSGN
jgi:hypothetical protein